MTSEAIGLMTAQVRAIGDELEFVDRAIERGDDVDALRGERDKLAHRLDTLYEELNSARAARDAMVKERRRRELAMLKEQLGDVTRELAVMPAFKIGTQWHTDRVDEAQWLARTIERMENTANSRGSWRD
jgi:hypothetical protein